MGDFQAHVLPKSVPGNRAGVEIKFLEFKDVCLSCIVGGKCLKSWGASFVQFGVVVGVWVDGRHVKVFS